MDYIATTRYQKPFLSTDTVEAGKGLVKTPLGLSNGLTLSMECLLSILLLRIQAL